jgi:TrmH family RNA methyltransferase
VALTLEEFGAMVAERGSAVWVAAADGESVRSRPPPSNLALVVGNEGSGVGKEISALATHRVAVPLGAEAESLNVAIAAGILLYEVLRDD